MDCADALIAELARVTCEEMIPVGFEDDVAPAVDTPTFAIELDDEIPF